MFALILKMNQGYKLFFYGPRKSSWEVTDKINCFWTQEMEGYYLIIFFTRTF